MVRTVLRLEGLAVFSLSLLLYHLSGRSWTVFLLLLFLPDISMIGYLKNKKIGAITYNTIHNYIVPIVCTLLSFQFSSDLLFMVGIILLAHVSLDRTIGYGLKYSSAFTDTHLQKV